MTTYTITDTITASKYQTTDIYQTVRALFQSDDPEVLEAINALADKAARGEYTGAEEAYLGVTIEKE